MIIVCYFPVRQKQSILHKWECNFATKSSKRFVLRANFIKLFCNTFTQPFWKLSHFIIVHLFHGAQKWSILHKRICKSVTKKFHKIFPQSQSYKTFFVMYLLTFCKLDHFIIVHYFPVAQKLSILHKCVHKSVTKKLYRICSRSQSYKTDFDNVNSLFW